MCVSHPVFKGLLSAKLKFRIVAPWALKAMGQYNMPAPFQVQKAQACPRTLLTKLVKTVKAHPHTHRVFSSDTDKPNVCRISNRLIHMIHMYIYIHLHFYTYIQIYLYVEVARDRERERERQRRPGPYFGEAPGQ